MKILNEESEEFAKIKAEWFREAKQVKNEEELAKFIHHLLNDYQHDYGTVVRAISAMALAAAWMGAAKEGITGFQASFVLWDFIKNWSYPNNKTGLRIIDYDKMLYPQYEKNFAGKIITKATWELLQKEAKNRLENIPFELSTNPTKVQAHLQSIVDGVVPFGYEVETED